MQASSSDVSTVSQLRQLLRARLRDADDGQLVWMIASFVNLLFNGTLLHDYPTSYQCLYKVGVTMGSTVFCAVVVEMHSTDGRVSFPLLVMTQGTVRQMRTSFVKLIAGLRFHRDD